MARFQREYVALEEQQTSNSQTYKAELPESGLLSALQIKVQADNGATENAGNPILENVSKIEIIGDGSEVIYSTSAHANVRNYWLKNSVFPPANIDETANATQSQTFYIYFGRKIGDNEYGLDLLKWNDVEVKITYNLATKKATGATGYVSGTARITIVAWRALKGQFSIPRGYVKTSEVENFSSAASGDKIVELPLRHKYVGVGVYAFESGVADNVDITSVKVDVDNGAQILYKSEWDHLQEENTKMFSVDPEVKMKVYRINSSIIETYTGGIRDARVAVREVAPTSADQIYLSHIDTTTAGLVEVEFTSSSFASAGAEAHVVKSTRTEALVEAEGIGVGNYGYIPFDIHRDFSGLLNSKEYDSIDLILTQGGAGGTVEIVLEEVVTA